MKIIMGNAFQPRTKRHLVEVVVVQRGLRLAARARHHGHGVYGVVSVGRLAREHNAVGAVKHSVGDVGALRTGRSGR